MNPHPLLPSFWLPAICGVALLCLAGCSRNSEPVVARVDGSPITRQQLDRAVDRVLGERTFPVDEATRRKVLESLVLNRLMAQKMEPQLSADEKRLLDIEIEAYQEQLLTRMYLARHAPPRPLSEDAIRDYYDKNPVLFGGGSQRRFDMIATVGEIKDAQRPALLAALNKLSGRPDWKEAATALSRQGFPVQFKRGAGDDAVLHPRLRNAIAGMPLGGDAQVVLAEGRPYLVRVTGEVTRPPKPLAEVRQDIAKALVALQLKQALDAVSKEALGTAKVEYAQEVGGGE